MTGASYDPVAALQAVDPEKVSRGKLCKLAAEALKYRPTPELVRFLRIRFGLTPRDVFMEVSAGAKNDLVYHCPESLTPLVEWLDITQDLEPPGIYHAMAFLTWAGAIMGRKVFVNMGSHKIYPTISSILVGPSGGRKSTAIRVAQNLLTYYPDELPHLIVFKDKVTSEGIIHSLQRQQEDYPGEAPIALIVAPELSTALGKQSYMQGIVVTLTRGMDHEGIHATTVSGGRKGVDDAGIGLLGGTTEDWIESAMTPDVVKAGFTARVLWAVENSITRISYKPSGDLSTRIQTIAINLADILSELPDSIELSKQADEFLQAWYVSQRIGMAEKTEDHFMDSYRNRKQEHILRLSLVLSVLKGDPYISESTIQGVLDFLSYLEEGFKESLRRLSAPAEHRVAMAAYDLIQASGAKGLPRPKLFKILGAKHPSKEILEALSFLLQSELVRIDKGRFLIDGS